jgi:hypothetical protein
MSDDSAPSEEYVKENDYTISALRQRETVLVKADYPLTAVSSLTRSFNFLAQLVTTVTRDYVYQAGGYKYGGSSGVSVTTAVQNFDDIQSQGEIEAMHARLKALGGNPPELDELAKEGRKALRLPLPGGR